MPIKKRIKHVFLNIVALLKQKQIVPIVVEKEESKLLEGKVALITGGSGGIGFAIAKKYAECGCKVILSGTNATRLNKFCTQINGSKSLVMDYKKINDFDMKIKEASEIFGRIDILVCSSGVHTDYPGFDWSKVTEQDYRCNARCSMCNRYKAPSKPEEDISIETIKKLPKMYFTNITGGEPFIRTDLRRTLRIWLMNCYAATVQRNGSVPTSIMV